MVYIVGVNHVEVQCEYFDHSNAHLVAPFVNWMRNKTRDLQLTVLAEEFSEDCFTTTFGYPQLTGKERSSAQKIADEFHIRDIFCDPTIKDRDEWGIQDDQTRERFWLGRIIDLKIEKMLFICGGSHVQSFKRLLKTNGFMVGVIEYTVSSAMRSSIS